MTPSKLLVLILNSTLFLGTFLSALRLSLKEIKNLANQKFPEAIFELKSFLKLPNDVYFSNHIENNLKRCRQIFIKLNFDVRTISTEGAPLLFAKKCIENQGHPFLFVDRGLPVDISTWDRSDPFKPVLKEKAGQEWKIIDFDGPKTEFDLD